MIKKILSSAIAVAFTILIFCSCSKDNSNPLNKFLGDYSYSDPAVCMVYEQVEGETDDEGNPCYGIQYRKITDLDGMLASGNTFLLYFYSSMDNGSAEVTASVEDLAQKYNGKLYILMLDAMEYKDKMEKYDIEAVPDFVLIRPGQADQIFGAASYEYWTLNDVIAWLQTNGVN